MMGQHPINLAVRFMLEILALVAMGAWGWSRGDGLLRFVWALLIPLLAAALWGVFRGHGDPGDAPIAVPGVVRLLLELAFFGFATWALYRSVSIQAAWIFGIITLVHYSVSYDRVLWLIEQ